VIGAAGHSPLSSAAGKMLTKKAAAQLCCGFLKKRINYKIDFPLKVTA